MKTPSEFLLRLANRPAYNELSLSDRERLREIAQQIEDEREIIEAVAELNARVGSLVARRPKPAYVAWDEYKKGLFTPPPVDPLEAITPTYQGETPS